MANRIDITEKDHEDISRAIKAAEQRTSGEIFAVVAQQSDDYFFVAGFMAALWSQALAASLALVFWYLGYPISLFVYVAAQLTALAAFIVLFRLFPALRMRFVPRSVAYRRASNSAVRQFLAHGVHATQDRTGVLLFVSVAERYAEVVADSGINEKVDQTEFDSMVAAMTSAAARGDVAAGFVQAIERAGSLLAQHFPPQPDDQNELDDRLMEI